MTSKEKCALTHVLKFVSVMRMVISTKPDGSFETKVLSIQPLGLCRTSIKISIELIIINNENELRKPNIWKNKSLAI